MEEKKEEQKEEQKEEKIKSGKWKTIAIIILSVLVVLLAGYIIYDKCFAKDKEVDQKEESKTKTEEKATQPEKIEEDLISTEEDEIDKLVEKLDKEFESNKLKVNETCLYPEEIKNECMIYEDESIKIKRVKAKDSASNSTIYVNDKLLSSEYYGIYDEEESYVGIEKMYNYYHFRLLDPTGYYVDFIIDEKGNNINDNIIKSISTDLKNNYSIFRFDKNNGSILVHIPFSFDDNSRCERYQELIEMNQKFGFVNAYFSIAVDKETNKLGSPVVKYSSNFKDFEKEFKEYLEEYISISEDGKCTNLEED